MKYLLFSSIFVFLCACKKDSSEIDQEKIYQSYTMTYDEDNDQTTVTARFFEEKLNGKALELSDGSTITMNGTTMTKSGTSYSTTVSGNLALATLVFTNTDGKKYTNSISKAEFIGNANETYLDNSFTDYWYWYGSAIAAGETVNLVLTNADNTSISSSFEENIVGREYMTLSASSLANLPDGNTKVVISRTKTITTGNFEGVGGKIVTSFHAVYNYVEVY